MNLLNNPRHPKLIKLKYVLEINEQEEHIMQDKSAEFDKGYQDYLDGANIASQRGVNPEYLNGMLFAEKITKCRFSEKSWNHPKNYRTSANTSSLFL